MKNLVVLLTALLAVVFTAAKEKPEIEVEEIEEVKLRFTDVAMSHPVFAAPLKESFGYADSEGTS
jgi:hypothetical protein